MKKSLEQLRFVVIGGGTGTYSVLSGLKEYTENITAIVTMADSGGSAKKERDEWGLLPSSDIRKSLLALADVSRGDSLVLRQLFEYRYSEGIGISGMTFGNLFLVALTKILNSQMKAVRKASEILHTKGKVLPVTLDKVDLIATYEDGSRVIGEHFIDEPEHNGKLKIEKIETSLPANILPEVGRAVSSADVIIIGPGGLYTTLLANLIIGGMKEALLESKALKVFIMNLMTEYGQTYGFTANRFIRELDKYFPSSRLDYVVMNNAHVPPAVLKRYRKTHAEPVANDIPKNAPFKVIEADLLSSSVVKPVKGDTLKRSLIRHDPEKIARLCMDIAGSAIIRPT